MSDRYQNPEEVVRRGEEIYQKDLRAVVEPEHIGKFLALDVETGDYEIDLSEIAVIDRANARRPDGARTRCLLRIGSRATHQIGGAKRPDGR
jgi:hypothetical protein